MGPCLGPPLFAISSLKNWPTEPECPVAREGSSENYLETDSQQTIVNRNWLTSSWPTKTLIRITFLERPMHMVSFFPAFADLDFMIVTARMRSRKSTMQKFSIGLSNICFFISHMPAPKATKYSTDANHSRKMYSENIP